MALTAKDLENKIIAAEKDLILKVANVIKSYTDNKVSVTADEIKKEVVDNLSKIDGLGEQLEKIQKMADAFAKVFDENNDGTITAEEIVAKLSAIQANIDKVEANVEALAKKEADDIADALQKIATVNGKVEANIQAIEKVNDNVKKLAANVSTNYYTKDEIAEITTIATDEIVKAVEEVFGVASDAKTDSNSGSTAQ